MFTRSKVKHEDRQMKVGRKGYDPIRHSLFLNNKLCSLLVMKKGARGLDSCCHQMAFKSHQLMYFKLLVDEDKLFGTFHIIFRCIK